MAEGGIGNFRVKDIDKRILTYASGSNSLRYVNFGFLKLGDLCNLSKPRSFSQAYCDLQLIENEHQIPYILNFEKIFCRGVKLLRDIKKGERKQKNLTKCELQAMKKLDTFFKDKDKDEESLHKVLPNPGRKKDKISETQCTLALAEHIFRKLAPTEFYSIDNKSKLNKREQQKCSCESNSCESKDSVFGETGIGSNEGWHGYIDVMIGCEDPAASEDESDSENSGGTTILEVKLSLKTGGVFDQAMAQTIVFSVTQRQRHPALRKVFIPNILVSPTEFRVFMYDSDYDILIYSVPLNIFHYRKDGELSIPSIIVLWMVLHYKLFCEETKSLIDNRDIDEEKAKSTFKEKDKKKTYSEPLLYKANYFSPPAENTLISFRDLSLGVSFK